MAAQKMPITVYNRRALGFDAAPHKRVTMMSLAAPQGRNAVCRLIGGDTPEQAGENLARALREAGLV